MAAIVWDFQCMHKCWCMQLHTGAVWTPQESLHWKLTLGEKSLAASGTWTCISIAPGCSVGLSTNWAILAPCVHPDIRASTVDLALKTVYVPSPLSVCSVQDCTSLKTDFSGTFPPPCDWTTDQWLNHWLFLRVVFLGALGGLKRTQTRKTPGKRLTENCSCWRHWAVKLPVT